MLRDDDTKRWMRAFAPVVWLAVLQVFILSLLASSPQLHECVHSDSQDAGHHCLVTDFTSGTVDQTTLPLISAPDFRPLAIANEATPDAVCYSLAIHLCGSLLEHGPPQFA